MEAKVTKVLATEQIIKLYQTQIAKWYKLKVGKKKDFQLRLKKKKKIDKIFAIHEMNLEQIFEPFQVYLHTDFYSQ